MKKNYIILLILMLAAPCLFAQNNEGQETEEEEKNWVMKGSAQQNLNQLTFTNWAAGGENSFSSNSRIRFSADYSHENISWENSIDMSYGVIKIEDNPMRKNTDRIELFSKLGRKASSRVSYSSVLNFQTQFDKGYNYPDDNVVVSRFMAPGFLTLSLGLDYKPFDYLSLFFSPAAGKVTFVLDDELSEKGVFGVDEGDKFKPEFGALLRLEFEKEVVTNVDVKSRLILFNSYTHPEAGKRKNSDVDWTLDIDFKINSFLTANIGMHLLYDDAIKIEKTDDQGQEYLGPTTQLKQHFGIGLIYSFER